MATKISFLDGSFKRPLHTSPNSPVRMQKNKTTAKGKQLYDKKSAVESNYFHLIFTPLTWKTYIVDLQIIWEDSNLRFPKKPEDIHSLVVNGLFEKPHIFLSITL